MPVKLARVAEPNTAAIATRAHAVAETPRPGATCSTAAPKRLPNPALISRIGASVPPEVPEARAIHQASSLAPASAATAVSAMRAWRTSPIAS